MRLALRLGELTDPERRPHDADAGRYADGGVIRFRRLPVGLERLGIPGLVEQQISELKLDFGVAAGRPTGRLWGR
jgi:hypothetical protein